MHPCVKCKNKGKCPERCFPKLDYERHVDKINRRVMKNARMGMGGTGVTSVSIHNLDDVRGQKDDHNGDM